MNDVGETNGMGVRGSKAFAFRKIVSQKTVINKLMSVNHFLNAKIAELTAIKRAKQDLSMS